MPEKDRYGYHAAQVDEPSVGQGRKRLSEHSRKLPAELLLLLNVKRARRGMMRGHLPSQQE
jgi:hypothetical protein